MGRKIALALCDRGHFSTERSRRTMGHALFHWAITIIPEISQGNDCDEYDATDLSEIDKTTWRMTNPSMDWWFRVRSDVDLDHNPKTVGHVVIGFVSDEVSRADLKELFTAIPLPVKNSNPQQNCLTWVVDAIKALQKKRWVRDFEIQPLKDWALRYADERLNKTNTRQAIEEYPEGRN